MIKLNRKIEYALMALKYMSQKFSGQLTSVKEVCEQTGCPFDATARVMQLMAQKGLLKSEQGIRGGYMIVQDLTKVSFYDLVEMILGSLGIAKCIHGVESCDLVDRCNIQSPVKIINERLLDFYTSLSLQEILSSNTRVASRQQQMETIK